MSQGTPQGNKMLRRKTAEWGEQEGGSNGEGEGGATVVFTSGQPAKSYLFPW